MSDFAFLPVFECPVFFVTHDSFDLYLSGQVICVCCFWPSSVVLPMFPMDPAVRYLIPSYRLCIGLFRTAKDINDLAVTYITALIPPCSCFRQKTSRLKWGHRTRILISENNRAETLKF